MRMTDEQFETICNIIKYEDWNDWEFKFVEEITYCDLIAEYSGKQIHMRIDLYGVEVTRRAVLFGEDDYAM